MNQKHNWNIYCTNVNVNLIVENITQVKSGIMINLDMTPKI